MKAIPILLTIIGMAGLPACDSNETGPCRCTEEFVTVGFHAVDQTGAPVEGIEVTVTQARTGEVLLENQDFDSRGYYVVASDVVKDKLLGNGEVLNVTGIKDSLQFEESFVVGVPGGCRCHVQKFAGPDTLYLTL